MPRGCLPRLGFAGVGAAVGADGGTKDAETGEPSVRFVQRVGVIGSSSSGSSMLNRTVNYTKTDAHTLVVVWCFELPVGAIRN